MDKQVAGAVLFGVVAMVSAPATAGCRVMQGSCNLSVVVVVVAVARVTKRYAISVVVLVVLVVTVVIVEPQLYL